MKNLAFLVAVALLTLAVPASADEISAADSGATFEQQQAGDTATPLARFDFNPPTLLPRCALVNGTSCTKVGSTMGCTDACNNQLSCTCVSFNSMLFWYCQQEC